MFGGVVGKPSLKCLPGRGEVDIDKAIGFGDTTYECTVYFER